MLACSGELLGARGGPRRGISSYEEVSERRWFRLLYKRNYCDLPDVQSI
jgi:hypothetical protein